MYATGYWSHLLESGESDCEVVVNQETSKVVAARFCHNGVMLSGDNLSSLADSFIEVNAAHEDVDWLDDADITEDLPEWAKGD